MTVKILFVLPTLRMGGAEKVMISLFNNIDKGFLEPSIVAFSNGSLKSKIKDQSRLTVLEHDSVLSGVFGFSQLVRSINPDVVFSTHSHLNALLCFLKKLNIIKSKLIIRESNYLSKQQSHGKSLYEKYFITFMIKTFYHNADHLICQSNEMLEDIYSFIPKYTVPATVIYNPIENIPPYINKGSKKQIISIGRLDPQKNHQLLIKAFDKIKNTIPHSLVIIGDGSEYNNLRKIIVKKGLEDRVQLTGFIENVWDEYSNSALFVLSSNYEGFPNVILEAMANSTPVVSSDCPSGPKEIIQHGINGFLFEVGDIDGLAKCIKHAILTETAISSIRHRAYLDVKAYSITHIVNKYENIFQTNN